MKKLLIIVASVLAVLILLIGAFVLYQTRDRHPGYSLDVTLPQPDVTASGEMHVGLAKTRITPNIQDTWVDVDSNARYEPDQGDTFIDANENGKFDAFWLAGFQNRRPAQGVHDDIWARAIVWDDGAVQLAYVMLDVIGLFHDDVITLRNMVKEQAPEIDHVIVSATHCHEVPDLMGMWGKSYFKSGVNTAYLRFVQEQTAQAIADAYEARQPAVLSIAKIDSVEKDLVEDGRPPYVFDDGIRMMRFTHAETGEHLGILLNYGCHPETLGSRNLMITADYLHYWLGGLERGIYYDGEQMRPGVGGLAVYAQGAIGGLMTAMGNETYDPWIDKTFESGERTFDKARAQGYRLAANVLDELETGTWQTLESPDIRVRAQTFRFKLQNKIFTLAGILGVFDRGFQRLKYLRSEVNLVRIGSAWFLTLPGEVNPEILNGGIETPEHRDFQIEPVEVPPLRQLMQGDINFAIGLANDEVGYIMPKTHWDTEAPFTYGRDKAMYGEVNSLGPDAGPVFYEQVKTLLEEM